MTSSNKVKNLLPFDPKTEEYKSYVLDIDVNIASYILNYHNFDNRKFSNSQINNIYKSISLSGWLIDGQPITFNVDGNLTEGQHRLAAIVRENNPDKTYKVILVTGVARDTFSQTATNKTRKPIDEIQRKHKTAHKDEVSVLGDLLKRKKCKRLSLQNAIKNYEEWIRFIEKALKNAGDYEWVLDKWSLQRKTIGAFITLCRREDYYEECKTLMELLDNEEQYNNSAEEGLVSTQLPREFIAYYNKYAVDLSNERRMDFLYSLLCVALDIVSKRPDGNVPFADIDSTPMSRFADFVLKDDGGFYELNLV
tara:strand:- start:238 stop:1164 length:927 start_codon:yes stop_codon:yes gene_type:complete